MKRGRIEMPDDATIRLMWAAGKTGSQIAEALGRKRGAILRRVRELDLARRTDQSYRNHTDYFRQRKVGA
jgi:hypothetical protein